MATVAICHVGCQKQTLHSELCGQIVVLLQSYLCHRNSSMVSNYTLLQIKSELTLTEKAGERQDQRPFDMQD